MDPTKTPETDTRRRVRKVVTEKFAVRVFREKFIDAAIKAGILPTVLDDFLRTVLTSGDADAADRRYARTTYQNAVVRLGGTGLPTWAREAPAAAAPAQEAPALPAPRKPLNTPPKGPQMVFDTSVEDTDAVLENPDYRSSTPAPVVNLSDEDFQAMIEGADGPHGIVGSDEFDDLLGLSELDMLTTESGIVWQIMRHRFGPKMIHPFVESFEHEGVRYVAVGTVSGKIPTGAMQGKPIQVNFTVVPYRSIRDVPSEVILRRGGRFLSVTYENYEKPGLRKTLYILRHRPGLKLRFWSRVDDHDVETGRRFVILTDDASGWKEVDRKQF